MSTISMLYMCKDGNITPGFARWHDGGSCTFFSTSHTPHSIANYPRCFSSVVPAAVLAAVPSSWRACLTTQQRIGSLVKPKKYSKADGFVACGRFQYKCDSPQARPANVTACSAADVKAGAWQWHYTALTQQQCDRLPVEAAKLGLQHAVCCLTDNCNLPDRTLDSSTEVVRWTGLVTSSNTSTRSG